MIISDYKHKKEKKKRNIMYLSKTKLRKMELILEAVHSNKQLNFDFWKKVINNIIIVCFCCHKQFFTQG